MKMTVFASIVVRSFSKQLKIENYSHKLIKLKQVILKIIINAFRIPAPSLRGRAGGEAKFLKL